MHGKGPFLLDKRDNVPASDERAAVRHPADVATARTLAFVRAHVPTGQGRGPRLLEIGCGDGALARSLMEGACEVVAIDESERAIEAASRAGVDARRGSWPTADVSAPFDVLLFPRSLHHMHSVEMALDRAREVLAPGGVVIVEDFAFAEADAPTVAWFSGVLSALDAAGLITRAPGELGTRMLEAGSWHDEHAHHIAPASQMRAALGARFTFTFEGSAPYLYRYFIPLVSPDADGAALVERVADLEAGAAAAGFISLIGRRWVARNVSAAPPTRG